MKTINARLTLVETMLATKPANLDIFDDWVKSKAPTDEAAMQEFEVHKRELESPEHLKQAGTTIFDRATRAEIDEINKAAPFNPALPPTAPPGPENPEQKFVGIWDYMIKGFFKDACAALNRCDPDVRNGLDRVAAYKSKIDGCIFVYPRFIVLNLPPGGSITICQRPLRADTPMGPRVSICRSEMVPPGTTLDITISILSKDLIPHVELWLNYGQRRGLGQWRNSSRGRFSWQQIQQTDAAA